MTKAILFDFDGVLTTDKTGSFTICKYISAATGIEFERISNCYIKYNNDLLYGKTTHEEIWNDLCEDINAEIDIKHLYDSFINTPFNEPVLNLVKDLRASYKTGIITDNKKDRITVIADKQKLNDFFDTIILSADVGSGKDNEAIFNKTIKSLNVEYEECIFIDNQEKNLLVPNLLGMKVIFYNHEVNDVNELIFNLKELKIKI